MANMNLFDEYPILVDRILAEVIGLNEAIVIQQLHYWIQLNRRNRTAFYDERYWTFGSIKKWHEENFRFWSIETVRRTFKSLEKKGLLIVGNYNKKGYDRTKWYSIDYDKLYSIHCNYSYSQNDQMDVVKMTNSMWSKRLNGYGQNDQTYTRDYKEINKETNTTTEVVCSEKKKSISLILEREYKSDYTDEFIDRIEKILTDKNKDIDYLKEKIKMSLSGNVKNRNGYLIEALKNDYKNIKNNKKNSFNNFDSTFDKYSEDELNELIRKNQERKLGGA